MNKKVIFLPPLFGSFIALLCVIVHLFFINIHILEKPSMWLNFFLSLLEIIPITYFVLSVFSYFFYFTIGYGLLKIKNKYNYSSKFFWFISFVTGLLVGLIIIVGTNYIGHGLSKSFLTITSFSLGSLFTASLFSVLNNELK